MASPAAARVLFHGIPGPGGLSVSGARIQGGPASQAHGQGSAYEPGLSFASALDAATGGSDLFSPAGSAAAGLTSHKPASADATAHQPDLAAPLDDPQAARSAAGQTGLQQTGLMPFDAGQTIATPSSGGGIETALQAVVPTGPVGAIAAEGAGQATDGPETSGETRPPVAPFPSGKQDPAMAVLAGLADAVAALQGGAEALSGQKSEPDPADPSGGDPAIDNTTDAASDKNPATPDAGPLTAQQQAAALLATLLLQPLLPVQGEAGSATSSASGLTGVNVAPSGSDRITPAFAPALPGTDRGAAGATVASPDVLAEQAAVQAMAGSADQTFASNAGGRANELAQEASASRRTDGPFTSRQLQDAISGRTGIATEDAINSLPAQGATSTATVAGTGQQPKTQVKAQASTGGQIAPATARQAPYQAGTRSGGTGGDQPQDADSGRTPAQTGPDAVSAPPGMSALASSPAVPSVETALTAEKTPAQDQAPQDGQAMGPPTAGHSGPPSQATGHQDQTTATTAGQSASGAMAYPAVTSQLVAAVTRSIRDRSTHFEIRLDPADLGHVRVQLQFNDNGTASAHIVTESREAMNMLMSDRRALEETIRNSGYDPQGNLAFSFNGGNAGQQGQQNNFTRTGQSSVMSSFSGDNTLTPEAAAVTQAYRVYRSGGVDITI